MIVQDGEKCTSYERRVVYLSSNRIKPYSDRTLDWKTDKVFALDNGRKYCNISRARLIPGEKRYRAQIDSSLYFTAERDG